MTFRTSAPPPKPAILVISCSDARLTPQDSINSWRSRLNFNGDIYEVRCPGGGLAMADRNSAYFQSAFESFKLLESTSHIAEIVLAFHEDCAYFADKYGATRPAEDERRKWHLVQEAVGNVTGWSNTVYVRPLHMSLPGHRHDTAPHSHSAPPHRPERERPPHTPAPYAPTPVPRRRMEPQFIPSLPSERATLRAFDRQVEERLLHTTESTQDIIALAEGQAREQGVIPAWRAERRALEFIALLRDEGKKKPNELRQLARSFLQSYASSTLPRTVLRSLLSELDVELQSQRLHAGAR